MAEVLASALRLDGSSRLKLMADATKLLAPALAPLLPVYAIDAPAGAPAGAAEAESLAHGTAEGGASGAQSVNPPLRLTSPGSS